MELRAGYKKTEIGVIPEDWAVKKLSECLIKNPDYGINAAAVEYDDTLPTYLRITDISEDGKYLNSNKVSVNSPLSNSYYLEEGDIVFARTGASVGKTYLYTEKDGKLIFAGFLIRIKANPEILDFRYLIFLTQTKQYWSWVSANSMRSGQPGLNSNEYKSFQIPLPKKTEQTAIATALSDADALISSLEKLIIKKRNIKQGAMQKLLQPKEGWEVKKLGEVVEIRKGQLITESTRVNGNTPVIAGGKTPAYFHNKPNRIGKTITISGSGASAGYVAFHNYPIFASDCSTIEEHKDYSIEYVFYLLQLLQEKIYKKQTGGAQPHIHPSDLNTIEVSFPKKENQEQIATILSDMDTEIQALETKLEKYKNIKLGMMQELLTGKIRLI